MSPLSVDILHQVFRFFVSNNQIVDGESLRTASLVCKQWRDVADSKSLWSIPARVQERPWNTHAIDQNDVRYSDRIYQSLRILERNPGKSLPSKPLNSPSLMGFVKVKHFHDKQLSSKKNKNTRYKGSLPELYFLVRERATGCTFLLTISKDRRLLPSIVSDLYVHHFESKSRFLCTKDMEPTKESFYPYQIFPLGVSVWKGRFVRWYRSENETDAISTIENISPTRKKLLHRQLPLSDAEQKVAMVHHLMELEKSSFVQRGTENVYAEGREHLADWLAEIAECFELQDRTIFHAMLLFDQFVASSTDSFRLHVCNRGQRLLTSRLQLLGGACLFVASKCNKTSLSEKDISYCCDNKYDVADIMNAEKLLLYRLDWQLACPSSTQFLTALWTILGTDLETSAGYLSCYICESSLAFHTSFRFSPSVQAASAVVLARYTLMRNDEIVALWPEELENITGLSLREHLVECSVQMSNDSERIRIPGRDMIYRRYSKASRYSVAQIRIPVVTSISLTAYEERLRSRGRQLLG